MDEHKVKTISELSPKELSSLQRKAIHWHLMILEYIFRNRRTRAQLSKGKRFLNIERNAEPTNRKELMKLISNIIP